ncbi:MAG: hypothetical protein JNM39_11790 [Bdellovibrionaceae bacterium]|nr:hypothetical protein [Pseudobdellovibrionaceae bacterium]
MRPKHLQFLFIFVSFLSSVRGFGFLNSQSNYHIGVIICPDKIELLDTYEARILRELVTPANINFETLLAIINKSMPDRADLYRNTSRDFQNLIHLTDDSPMEPMPKKDLILNPPEGCQYSVLLTTEFQNTLLIRKTLWERLSSTDRVAVRLNWSIAKEAFVSNHQIPPNSIYIRNLTSLMLNDQISALPLLDLIAIIRAAGLHSLRRQGILIDLMRPFTVKDDQLTQAYPMVNSEWLYEFTNSGGTTYQVVRLKGDIVNFHPNGVVESLRFEDRLGIQTIGGKVLFITPDSFSTSPVLAEASPRISFFSSGGIRRGFTIDSSSFKSTSLDVKLAQTRGRWERFNNSLLTFFPGGDLDTITHVSGLFSFKKSWLRLFNKTSVVLSENQFFKELTTEDPLGLVIQGRRTYWKGYLSFNENDQLICGFVDQDTKFLGSNSQTRSLRKGEQICFNKEGLAL